MVYCYIVEKLVCYVGSSGFGLATTSVVADSTLEAGGVTKKKVFTSLMGKGVKLWIRGKSADNLFTEIDSEISKSNG